MDEGGLGQWLTLDELAVRTGRKATGLRTWAQRRRRDGRHEWRKNNAGQWTVRVTPEVLGELEQGVDEGASLSASLSDEALREALADAQAEVANLREALMEARVGQARAEGELAAEARRSADLLAALADERETARTMLDRERVRGDRLETALAEARKPALVRMLEALRRKG
jgi:NTP pyrophosphatase (non-canonical NTP hydrolase)